MDQPRAVKLDEFVKSVHNEAERFANKWRAGMKGKEKENWPASLPEPDWWEQFMVHIGSKK